MQVSAISKPSSPSWRWRISSYAGEVLAESHDDFPTISAALHAGQVHLRGMDATDRSELPRSWVGRPYGRRAQ